MKKVLFLLTFFCLTTVTVSAGNKIKTNYRNALLLAYSQANSVYEDENIKLEIYDEALWATNKTTKTIFIDYAQSFAYHNGASTPLFDNSDKKVGDKKASKKGISTKDDEYLSIAPNMGTKQNATFICNLSTRLMRQYTTVETTDDDFTEYDIRLLKMVGELITESKNASPKGKEYLGTVTRHMTEDESINNIGASIAYAFNKKVEEWNNVSLSTWVSDAIFTPYYIQMPKEIKKKEKKGFGIKETDPAYIHIRANSPFEFDEDKCPIIALDWEGDFKKGSFTLSTTRISKTKKASALSIVGAIFTYGATLLLNSYNQTHFKSRLKFDGPNSDWGKMTYVNDIMKTEQTD